MTTNQKLITRCDEIINLGKEAQLAENQSTGHPKALELFFLFKSSLDSFVTLLYGKDHSYFQTLSKAFGSNWYILQTYLGIVKAIKLEIEKGWLISMKGIISAELFNDFLEMADYLLQEKYKDPAAVLIGGVLEEHLRQLCLKNDIEIQVIKEEKSQPRKADQLNIELCKANVYNMLDQKILQVGLI